MTKFRCSRCGNMILMEGDVNFEGKKITMRVPIYMHSWDDLMKHYEEYHPDWTQIVATRMMELST